MKDKEVVPLVVKMILLLEVIVVVLKIFEKEVALVVAKESLIKMVGLI